MFNLDTISAIVIAIIAGGAGWAGAFAFMEWHDAQNSDDRAGDRHD